MLRRLLFGCSHQFSWPIKSPDGTYYQVCVRCGAEYSYDWLLMRRTKLLPVGSSAARRPSRTGTGTGLV